MTLQKIQSLADRIRTNVSSVIVGKEDVIDKLVIAIITSWPYFAGGCPWDRQNASCESSCKIYRLCF